MKTLQSREDFHWYKARLDVEGEYAHAHVGEPAKYPCVVSSRFWDDPNGPYTYYHEFHYQQEVVCEHCGHKQLKW